MAKAADKDDALKRLGGGRWQTRDDRFTIEPQSGTWVVVDAEQTDDLGLPLIRGPFGSLGAAKEAIATAREAAPAVSPLVAKMAELRDRPMPAPAAVSKAAAGDARAAGTGKAPKPKLVPVPTPKAAPPAEPKWLTDLKPADRRRAHELIDRLEKVGAPDPEGIARRDIAGGVPAAAAFAIAQAVAALGPEASPGEVARLVADGQDPRLGVRWRLIDDDGRPITIAPDRPARR